MFQGAAFANTSGLARFQQAVAHVQHGGAGHMSPPQNQNFFGVVKQASEKGHIQIPVADNDPSKKILDTFSYLTLCDDF